MTSTPTTRKKRTRWTPQVVELRVTGDPEVIARQVMEALREAAARVQEGAR